VPGVMVLGMHRSGTSAVTRILDLLGADLGPADELITEFDNPAGHWENTSLTRCNERILNALGRSWDFPPRLRPGWERGETASALLGDMDRTFRRVYQREPWAWKDPRLCLTLPLWRRVVGDVPVVLVWRDPQAVVRSLHRRDGIPELYGAGLWHRYLNAAFAAMAGLPVMCVRFEDVVGAPLEVTRMLATELRRLGVALDGDPEQAAATLDEQLVHRTPSTKTVRRLTSAAVERLRSLPATSGAFTPPPWHEPRWVGPVLVTYRGPWAVRARAGHPLRPGIA
jgi:hypothetical protein